MHKSNADNSCLITMKLFDFYVYYLTHVYVCIIFILQ